ncbi:MAG TPA: hypothetical protein VMA77_04915 [Solirubrobacteraceae bacterium]|nr:hypothetical protein [Solirubrobacteraceae bacterium]
MGRSTENATAAKALLSDLVERGLKPEQEIPSTSLRDMAVLEVELAHVSIASPTGSRVRRY